MCALKMICMYIKVVHYIYVQYKQKQNFKRKIKLIDLRNEKDKKGQLLITIFKFPKKKYCKIWFC